MSISWKALGLSVLAFVFVLHSASVQASSELLLLVNGQVLTATSHVYEGDSVVLQPSSGREMVFDRSLTLGIEPDASAAAEDAGFWPRTTLEGYSYADIITAVRYSLVHPYDSVANIEAGTKHLALLLGRYDIDSALAAYNAGEGAVQKFGGAKRILKRCTLLARFGC